MKQTVEEGMELCAKKRYITSKTVTRYVEGYKDGFKDAAAWQKEQGIDWISVDVMPKMNDLGILPILITDGKEVKVWYMIHPLVLKTGDFNTTHWAYITLPKTDK